jgi:hypothetical protein
MPPASVHFNGGVNLADTDTVLREIASRVATGVHRIPDGETGDRQHLITFQIEKFWQTRGIERASAQDQTQGYRPRPKVRLAASADPSRLQWPNLGYADAYSNSFESFRRMRDAGTIGGDVRFQVQYPTPLAAINAWFVAEDQPQVEPSYERALFSDLQSLLARLPHADIAVQWDVAVEIAILESAFEAAPGELPPIRANRHAMPTPTPNVSPTRAPVPYACQRSSDGRRTRANSTTSEKSPRATRTLPVLAAFRAAGLSCRVAIITCSPSQTNENGTRWALPSGEAVAIQSLLSDSSLCTTSVDDLPSTACAKSPSEVNW